MVGPAVHLVQCVSTKSKRISGTNTELAITPSINIDGSRPSVLYQPSPHSWKHDIVRIVRRWNRLSRPVKRVDSQIASCCFQDVHQRKEPCWGDSFMIHVHPYAPTDHVFSPFS